MPVQMQDTSEAASKQSTIYLGKTAAASWNDLGVDLGQYLTNMTVGAGNLSEASPTSARFHVSHPRTIGCVMQLDNNDTGTIFTQGSLGTLCRFDVSPAGTLRATNNNVVVGTLSIPDLAAGASQFVLAWTSRANPLATGAGDAVQSWLYAIDVASGEIAKTEFFHAARTVAASTARWGTLTNTVEGLWFANACQSLTEIARDWGVTSPSVPTSDCGYELPPLPLTDSMDLEERDAAYGPIPQWAAVHVRHAFRRHWTPLVNKVYLSQALLRTVTSTGDPAYRLAPDSLTYTMMRGWLAPAPVPPGVTHAWVRVQVRSWVASGLAVPFGIRVYSMSRLPDGPGTLVSHYAGEVVTRNDTSTGTGQWDVEQLVELAIGEDGWTYLCPAYAFDPASTSANDANARANIRAFHAVPCMPDA